MGCYLTGEHHCVIYRADMYPFKETSQEEDSCVSLLLLLPVSLSQYWLNTIVTSLSDCTTCTLLFCIFFPSCELQLQLAESDNGYKMDVEYHTEKQLTLAQKKKKQLPMPLYMFAVCMTKPRKQK